MAAGLFWFCLRWPWPVRISCSSSGNNRLVERLDVLCFEVFVKDTNHAVVGEFHAVAFCLRYFVAADEEQYLASACPNAFDDRLVFEFDVFNPCFFTQEFSQCFEGEICCASRIVSDERDDSEWEEGNRANQIDK